MKAGAERHARIERDGDRPGHARVRPRRSHEEPADLNGRDGRLPGLEPILVLDLADRELADWSEAEGLEMPKRVTRVRDLREGVRVVDEIRLDDVIRAAA